MGGGRGRGRAPRKKGREGTPPARTGLSRLGNQNEAVKSREKIELPIREMRASGHGPGRGRGGRVGEARGCEFSYLAVHSGSGRRENERKK